MISREFKLRVVEAIKENRKLYPTNSKQATSLEIKASQLSRLNKGEIDGVISDAAFVRIGRRLGVSITPQIKWKTVKTPTYEFIYQQLSFCQKYSVSSILCDIPDIGKTHTAKEYCRQNKNSVYIDCSQVKTKQRLVRQIAKEFGVDAGSRYADVYQDLVFFLQSIQTPQVVLDEVGDLNYDAFLEIKALWNATEGFCSWYLMGADGLKKKIDANKERKKVGYAEIFSRVGSKYQKVTPDSEIDQKEFKKHHFYLIAKANGIPDINSKCKVTGASLRKLQTEFKKMLNQKSDKSQEVNA